GYSSRAAATGCSTRLPSHPAAVAAHSMRLRCLPGAALLILAAAFALSALAQDKVPEYRLGPGDSIRISVFDNPNLTLETRVAENRIITDPLLRRVGEGG